MVDAKLTKEATDTIMIIQSLVRGFNATDRHDYDVRRSLWTDEVLIDFGGVKEPQIIKADDLIEWAKLAYRDMTTMHMTFNHEVHIDGDRATTFSYGRALHRQKVSRGEDFWFIYARYEHDLVKIGDAWKVSRIRMTPIFQEGNANLVNQAYEDTVRSKGQR